MLKKRERLTTRAFGEHFKSGRRFHSPFFTLVYTPAPAFHASVVVGKKVAKRAVDRNRLRRQIYGRLYHMKQHGSLTGVLIIIAKPTVAALTRSELTKELSALVGQATKRG